MHCPAEMSRFISFEKKGRVTGLNRTEMLPLQVVDQYEAVECTLATCVHNDTSKHECNHHDAVNIIDLRLRTRRHAIPASRFVLEYTIEGAPVCDVASKGTKAVVSELTVHAVANVMELPVNTFVLQKTSFPESELVTGLLDPLKSCG